MPASPSLDPVVQAVLEKARQAGRKPLWQCSPAEARSFTGLVQALFGPAPPGCSWRDVSLDTRDARPLPARLYLPDAGARGLVVYFHGGGWVLGSVESFHPLTAALAVDSSYAVLSVDYRLAPEHPYPAALEDARDALRQATLHLHDWLGGADAPLVVMGDSAGANLATVALRTPLTKAALRRVDLQILAYPVTDAAGDTVSHREFADGYLLTERDMQWFWAQYCPDQLARLAPEVSPLRATQLAGLPPTLVLTAECDPVRDEGERYARRLQQAGVRTELVRCPGLVHGFLAFATASPAARRAYQHVLRALSACHMQHRERRPAT